MSACTLTSVSLFPHLSELALVYRPETTNQLSKPQHFDFQFIGYWAGSALTTARQHFGHQEDMLPDYRPRTELGEKLLALRRAYIEKGGRLLSAGELEEELRSCRGGVDDA